VEYASYGVLTPFFINTSLGICQLMYPLRSTLLTALVEYCLWSTYAQLD